MMKVFRRYQERTSGNWLLLLALLAFLVGCAQDEDADQQAAPKLDIYIYAPGKMTPTRSDDSQPMINPESGESEVKKLQLWVYNSNNTSQLLGSFELGGTELARLNSAGSESYSMELPSSFAYGANPVVDVYVLANVTDNNCGAKKGTDSSLDELEDFKIDKYYFSPTTGIPADGLPMSGVMRRQSLVQHNDVFHLNEANIKLERAVSKVRFVFSSLSASVDPNIKSIRITKVTLDKDKLNQYEYLFLQNAPYRVGNTLNAEEITLLGEMGTIQTNEDPTVYAHKSKETAAEYEARINAAPDGALTKSSWLYLRESDQKLTGKIYYTIGGSTSAVASFSMAEGDFHRNQTWIVYAYYLGSSKLNVSTVQVTDWKNGGSDNQGFHNW